MPIYLIHCLKKSHFLKTVLLISLLFNLLSGCKQPIPEWPPIDYQPSFFLEYYHSKPEFFIFKTIDQLPKHLSWENGLNEPEYADLNAPKGGTIRLATLDFPRTLRAVGPDANCGMRDILYDKNTLGLLNIHPNTLKYIPAIASSWAIADDQKTVFFRINPKATYSDGHPIKTLDFFYTFYFMLSPCIQAPWYNNWYQENYESITYYDDLTFALTLKNKTYDPILLINMNPTPAHYYGILNNSYPERYQWDFPPTTGPYMIDFKNNGLQKGRKVILSRVKNWWAKDERYYRGRYNVDQIIYRTVRDPNIAFELFKKNEIDLIDLTLPEWWYYKSQIPAINQKNIIKRTFYNQIPRPPSGIYLNEADPLLKNLSIRKGIAHALNIEETIRIYFRNDYQRLRTCSDGFGPFTNPHVPSIPFNPETAKTYFAEAGFSKTNHQGILINDQNEPLTIKLIIPNNNTENIYTFLKNEALKTGLDIQLEVLEPLTAYGKLMQKNYQATISSWLIGFSSLPLGYDQCYHSKNAFKPATNNITNTADPILDQLIDTYNTTYTFHKLQLLAWEIQERIADRFAYIPTWYCPFYRIGYWKHIHFPENSDLKLSENAIENGLFWITPN